MRLLKKCFSSLNSYPISILFSLLEGACALITLLAHSRGVIFYTSSFYELSALFTSDIFLHFIVKNFGIKLALTHSVVLALIASLNIVSIWILVTQIQMLIVF